MPQSYTGSRRQLAIHADDDAPNECFRAYRHAKDSYRDHSKFLRTGARYAFLFRLKITDYKGWARGLKKAGYATDSPAHLVCEQHSGTEYQIQQRRIPQPPERIFHSAGGTEQRRSTKIRSFRKPEPYKGKGILFKGEVIRRKSGKSASAK